MSEDVGVKAPVTRLRRRLSIESEEVKSPAGTPTKKKGGRLATKPQLDLIEEIDAEQVPKRSTRRLGAKDIEPVEEKPITPSRRSARIRSNTSILSEPAQALNSPRAKRAAARRTSQAGSDNDTTLTPTRQTRRTRKDSTSSIDKQVDKTSNKTPAATEIIIEEQETDNHESSAKNKARNITPKSGGRRNKINDLSKSSNSSDEDIDIKHDKDLGKSTHKENQEIQEESLKSMYKTNSNDNSENKNTQNDNNSKIESNEILTKNIDAKPKTISMLHKSMSEIEDSKKSKSKRHRTISVSAIPTINTNECNFFSDNEISKKKKKNTSLTVHSNDVQDGETSKNNNDNSIISSHSINKNDALYNTGVSPKKNIGTEDDKKIQLKNTTKNLSINEESMTINEENINNSVPKTGWKKNIINQIQTENILESTDKINYVSPIKCFENAPSKNIQSVIILEDDSDSNAGNNGHIRTVPYLDSEDQCVPVVKHDNQTDSNEKIPLDNSYEPMDIDESIQQDTSMNKSVRNTPKALNQLRTKNQSLISLDQSNLSSNKSKRKSSLSSFESHNEKSTCESKSTLILSHIKNTSKNESVGKSPKGINKEQLSKSINIPDKIKDKEAERKKLSLDYSTSTPLQHKSFKKLGVPMDTSIINSRSVKKDSIGENKEESKENFNDLKKQNNTKSDDDSDQSDESGAELTKTQNELIDDEAEEASEDYQSGDSKDEDEREYEEQNRIVEKGETLDTEEEFSDDTDYEKDSFVVSSDEEDNELLSGSGDDLSMSDNELSMSAKSKKKYNEKKDKEQKKASREMYEARHKLNNSNKSVQKSKLKKSNRQRLDSSSSDSSEELNVQPKKNNRQMINSSIDLSDMNLDATHDESLTKDRETKRKNKQKLLSESAYDENNLNEQEITICNDSKMEDKDPISVSIKHEPKTPKKDSRLPAVIISEDIEEINIDQNKSILKSNETSDPLQATTCDTDEDSSSGEESKEIMKNYSAVLEDLNSKPQKGKMHNNSLNIDKKQKKIKVQIMDELNLTQTKSMKNKNNSAEIDMGVLETKSEKVNKSLIDKEDDDMSDSINMRLLFTEDSNDSETANPEYKKDIGIINIVDDKGYIPLKKTEAKTNLLSNIETETAPDKPFHLNESKKRINKPIYSEHISKENSPSDDTENEVNFFIDTTGNRDDHEGPINEPLSNSSKKKKTRTSEGKSDVIEIKESSIFDDEVVGQKTPKKSLNSTNQKETETLIIDEAANIIQQITPQSEKKKKKGKKSLNTTEKETEMQNEIDQNESKVTTKTPQSGRKKNKSMLSLDESENMLNIEEEKEQEISIEIKGDEKKKKAKKSLNNTQIEQFDETIEEPVEKRDQETSFDILTSSNKKKKKVNKSINGIQNESCETHTKEMEQEPLFEIKASSGKKKNKGKQSLTDVPTEEIQLGTSFDILTSSNKKKKKVEKPLTDIQNEQADESTELPTDKIQYETSFDILTSSNKKKKKVKNSVTSLQNEQGNEINDLATEQKVQESSFVIKDSSDKKMSKKSLTEIQNEQINEVSEGVTTQRNEKRKSSQSNIGTVDIIPLELNKSDDELPLEISFQSNKRDKSGLPSQISEPDVIVNNIEIGAKKRKRSATIDENVALENIKEKPNTEQLNESSTGRQKKKRKINNSQDISTLDTTEDSKQLSNLEIETNKLRKLKKNKYVTKQENIQTIDKDTEKANQNKKRKERDDDDVINSAKIFKHSSFNKEQVTRLPSYILNQLGDKPNKTIPEAKKSKVIATTKFTVEDAKVRRNKPSNYLEESVYLNDDNLVEKKQKSSIKKPKVLPFIPTASTSDKGFTSNFRINIVPCETQFVAQATNVPNFKKDFLQQQKIKKFHTFEKYKNHRNVKLSKF